MIRNLKKRKRGFLLAETTVKIIIALIALGFLIFLLTSLYFSKVRAVNQAKAESFLSKGKENLMNTIKNLSNGEEKTYISLTSPNEEWYSGWYLFSFTGDEKKPTKCERKNCLCICENAWYDWGGRQIGFCQDYGSCIIVPNLENKELMILISPKNPSLIVSKNNEGVVSIRKA